MNLRYFFNAVVTGSALVLGLAGAGQAQALRADSTQRPPGLMLKLGLRVTHLHYTHDNQSWQLLLPLSVGAEYRAAPRLSVYTLMEADMQANYTAGRRRGAQSGALPAALAALGLRYYYGQPHRAAPVFGRYLALEGNVDWEQLTISQVSGGSGRRRNVPTVLTPGVYAIWGVQHRLRSHLLYDINAGAGLLAPPYYSFERPVATNHWNVGGQVNIRVFFGG